jgi:hypothetical protein
MTRAFERVEPGAELPIAHLGFELLRPVPFAPLSISTRIARPGRRVQELAGELLADLGSAGEELICRARALRVQPIPDGLPEVPAPLNSSGATAARGRSGSNHGSRLRGRGNAGTRRGQGGALRAR